MTINDNMTEFMGRPIEDFAERLTNPTGVSYRIGLNSPDEVMGDLQRLLLDPESSKLQGLIVSNLPDVQERKDNTQLQEALIAAKDTLKGLEVLFIGDMTYAQREISWIEQSDVSPLLKAYPGLLHFGVRGGNGLAFSKLTHKKLRSLIVEAGGLSSKTIRQICHLDLPALEHLELWLGTDDYGGDSSVETLRDIFEGERFPHLKRLGLRNSMYTDEICEALIGAQVLENLSYLDLSMGTLSDQGAEHLLANPKIKELEALDLSHHYLSEATQERFKVELRGTEVILDNAQKPEEERYCAVTE